MSEADFEEPTDLEELDKFAWYIGALARAARLMDALPSSDEEKELEKLVKEIEEYEDKAFPF